MKEISLRDALLIVIAVLLLLNLMVGLRSNDAPSLISLVPSAQAGAITDAASDKSPFATTNADGTILYVWKYNNKGEFEASVYRAK